MHSLLDDIKKITSSSDRVESTLSGLLILILKLMDIEHKSPLLQSLGLEALYTLLGGHSFHKVIPVHFTEVRPQPLSADMQSSLIATLLSVAASNGDLLKNISIGLLTIVSYYNLKVTKEDKK